MKIHDIIFALLFVCLIAYFIAIYMRRSRKSKNRKYLLEKYPDGFVVDGSPYTFVVDAYLIDSNVDPEDLPVLEETDVKFFYAAGFQEKFIHSAASTPIPPMGI